MDDERWVERAIGDLDARIGAVVKVERAGENGVYITVETVKPHSLDAEAADNIYNVPHAIGLVGRMKAFRYGWAACPEATPTRITCQFVRRVG